MTKTAAALPEAALELPADERAALAEELLATVDPAADPAVEAAWAAEVEARMAAYRRGELAAFPADEVLAELTNRASR